jgi:hypothetical protein
MKFKAMETVQIKIINPKAKIYIERNGNTKYSTKILDRVEKLISLLIAYPELGNLTENKETRVIVKNDFLIFYEVSEFYVEVVSFWDGRQNPKYRIDKI